MATDESIRKKRGKKSPAFFLFFFAADYPEALATQNASGFCLLVAWRSTLRLAISRTPFTRHKGAI